jgi:hypothetical protein
MLVNLRLVVPGVGVHLRLREPLPVALKESSCLQVIPIALEDRSRWLREYYRSIVQWEIVPEGSSYCHQLCIIIRPPGQFAHTDQLLNARVNYIIIYI